MKSFFVLPVTVAMAAFPVFGGVAWSEESARPIGVLELFTSQGCSSCPPADALFEEIARDDDVIALAYHVNYWDYLGWRDTLGTPEGTARQYDYMRAFGSRSVYTPQAVINGRTDVNGANRSAVGEKLNDLAKSGEGMTVNMTVTRSGDSVIIDADGANGNVGEAHVVLVYFSGPRPIVIDRGENIGRTVTYWNAVSDIQTAGMWHGKPARYELPASEIAKKGPIPGLRLNVTYG